LLQSKWLYFIAGTLIIVLLLRHFLSVKESIERTTQIELPFGTETIETVDNYEYACEGKFLIPESEIRSFIREYGLQPVGNDPLPKFGVMLLSKKNQPVMHQNQPFFVLEDCLEQNSWRVLLNGRTGELWIVLNYPDMAGDYLPCNARITS